MARAQKKKKRVGLLKKRPRREGSFPQSARTGQRSFFFVTLQLGDRKSWRVQKQHRELVQLPTTRESEEAEEVKQQKCSDLGSYSKKEGQYPRGPLESAIPSQGRVPPMTIQLGGRKRKRVAPSRLPPSLYQLGIIESWDWRYARSYR